MTAELARRWQFPDTLLNAFAATARPLQAQPYSALGAVLHLAEALADTLDLGGDAVAQVQEAQAELFQRLRLNPQWLADKLLDPASLSEEVQLMTAG